MDRLTSSITFTSLVSRLNTAVAVLQDQGLPRATRIAAQRVTHCTGPERSRLASPTPRREVSVLPRLDPIFLTAFPGDKLTPNQAAMLKKLAPNQGKVVVMDVEKDLRLQ